MPVSLVNKGIQEVRGGGVADKGGWRCRCKPKIGSCLDLDIRG